MGAELRPWARRPTSRLVGTVSDGTPIRIRPMERADLDAVVAIEVRSFTAPWSRSAFERLLAQPSAGALVAEEDGDVAGYAVFWTVDDEAELGNLAVRPEARRRGLARRLVRAVSRGAGRAGAGALYLEVRESNEAARKLYREMGFRNVARRRGYYRSPPEDALVLRRGLGELVESPSAPGT